MAPHSANCATVLGHRWFCFVCLSSHVTWSPDLNLSLGVHKGGTHVESQRWWLTLWMLANFFLWVRTFIRYLTMHVGPLLGNDVILDYVDRLLPWSLVFGPQRVFSKDNIVSLGEGGRSKWLVAGTCHHLIACTANLTWWLSGGLVGHAWQQSTDKTGFVSGKLIPLTYYGSYRTCLSVIKLKPYLQM